MNKKEKFIFSFQNIGKEEKEIETENNLAPEPGEIRRKHQKEQVNVKSMPNRPKEKLIRNKTSEFLEAIRAPRETVYQPVSATKADIAYRKELFKKYPHLRRK